MGCLTATFEMVGGRLTSCHQRVGGDLAGTFRREPAACPGSFDDSFDFSFDSSAGGLQVCISRVCETDIQDFVRVEKEWVFLVPENLFTDDNIVYSNVEWNVT